MFGIPGVVGTILDLLVVVLGFGLIVFLHEAGHFFAARWAGIRVLAFAIGFGPAIGSYRKGIGFRRGTTEPAYRALLAEAAATGRDISAVSPTEYRLNALPLGGYVKMLGQDDMNPAAVSEAPDSYQNCPPAKRMVVISAGVVMNIITAAILFIIVFMVGLKVLPPVIGDIEPGSPAANALPLNAPPEAVGLRSGDIVTTINGREPNTFDDVRLAVAMTSRDTPVNLTVERSGVTTPLHFRIVPEVSPVDRLLSIGIGAPMSLTVSEAVGTKGENMPEGLGLTGIRPGAMLVSADGASVETPAELNAVFAESAGRPVSLAFLDGGERVVEPVAQLQIGYVPGADDAALMGLEHLLGLVPVMRVADGAAAVTEGGKKSGIEPGDIFAAIDGLEFPSLTEGIRRIRAAKGRDIPITVLREVGGVEQRLDLTVAVSGRGRIGFAPSDSAREDTLLAMPPLEIRSLDSEESLPPPASAVVTAPGMRVVSVGDQSVGDFSEIRTALQDATAAAHAEGAGATVRIGLEFPLIDASRPRIERDWELSPGDVADLHELAWTPPFTAALFEPREIELRASGPGEAIAFGLSETRRVLVTTYVTFVRLFERTVKIEHLKGPVGIAHIGTLLADRGFVWIMFFMAVISVNLAVINFLPLPIVDGGQFLMLVYEQVRGRPVPLPIQNAVTMAGLLLIVSLFLVVTFNDVRALLGI